MGQTKEEKPEKTRRKKEQVQTSRRRRLKLPRSRRRRRLSKKELDQLKKDWDHCT